LIDRRAVGVALVDEAQRDQVISQFRSRTSTAFLRAYWDATGTRADTNTSALLDLFLIEKAAYEIAYEAANRPAWIGVPLAGLARLVSRITEK
jgi:maltose alpha-D-glucosyltransferase/alpha-amylase